MTTLVEAYEDAYAKLLRPVAAEECLAWRQKYRKHAAPVPTPKSKPKAKLKGSDDVQHA